MSIIHAKLGDTAKLYLPYFCVIKTLSYLNAQMQLVCSSLSLTLAWNSASSGYKLWAVRKLYTYTVKFRLSDQMHTYTSSTKNELQQLFSGTPPTADDSPLLFLFVRQTQVPTPIKVKIDLMFEFLPTQFMLKTVQSLIIRWRRGSLLLRICIVYHFVLWQLQKAPNAF